MVLHTRLRLGYYLRIITYLSHGQQEAIQWLKQGLESFEWADVDNCMQQIVDLRKKVYGLGAPKSRNEIEARSISQNVRKEERCSTFRKNLIRTPQTRPKHMPKDYKEVLIMLRGGCQYVRLRKFSVCIVIAWPWLQGAWMLIAAKIVARFCNPPQKSHDLRLFAWVQFAF